MSLRTSLLHVYGDGLNPLIIAKDTQIYVGNGPPAGLALVGPTAGDVYYDGTASDTAWRHTGAGWVQPGAATPGTRVLAVQKNTSAVIANTVVPTLFSTQFTIPGGTFAVGDVLRTTQAGPIAFTTVGNVAFAYYLGGVKLGGSFAVAANPKGGAWSIETETAFIAGGVARTQMRFSVPGTAVETVLSNAAVDPTIPLTVAAEIAWSVANVANTASMTHTTVELHRAATLAAVI